MTTPRDDRRIVRLVQENAKTTVREIKEQLQLNVGLKTIKTRLREAILSDQIARNKLHINEVNQKRRF